MLLDQRPAQKRCRGNLCITRQPQDTSSRAGEPRNAARGCGPTVAVMTGAAELRHRRRGQRQGGQGGCRPLPPASCDRRVRRQRQAGRGAAEMREQRDPAMRGWQVSEEALLPNPTLSDRTETRLVGPWLRAPSGPGLGQAQGQTQVWPLPPTAACPQTSPLSQDRPGEWSGRVPECGHCEPSLHLGALPNTHEPEWTSVPQAPEGILPHPLGMWGCSP